jgi:O-antigen chain-terminating methyltransferase
VFRGASPEIKDRLRIYVPYARRAVAASGGAPVLDLGCGRGEWLEILREEQIAAEGVDGNAEMVQACLDLGLKARQADIISFLRGLADHSHPMVTAYHLLEHLAFEDVLEILVQTVRVLRPGGIAIFETPNPRNLLVASHSFHLDPTHNRPLPSELLSFVAEVAGLCELETLFLHPYPSSFHLDERDCAAAKFINEVFYGPQDYALIAKKV